jgi:hypothetical protein
VPSKPKETLPVRISGDGFVHKIEVAGLDLSNWVHRVELDIDASDRIPVLRLHMIAYQLVTDEHARVLLGAETEEALKAMGWTPPPEAT